MKIVVLDGFTLNPGDLNWNALKNLGECKIYDRTSLTDDAEIISRIGDAEIVFTNKTPLTKKILDACPNVKYIGVLATGYNVVDLDAAKSKKIPCWKFVITSPRTIKQFTTDFGRVVKIFASGIIR